MLKFILIIAIVICLLFITASILDSLDNANEKSNTTQLLPEETTKELSLKCIEYYDIPLSKELQEYTFEMCEKYNVPVKLALSVMYVESRYDENAVNGKCIGLMQVHTINMKELAKIGITDLTDPMQNIESGVYLLAECIKKTDDLTHALLVYNNGYDGARELKQRGVSETNYTRKVLEFYQSIKVKERIYVVE